MKHRLHLKSSTSQPVRAFLRRAFDGGILYKASLGELEIRADEATKVGELSGYASKFNIPDSYNDVIKRGAFKASLRDWKKTRDPIPMLWQHFSDMPIGGWTEFFEDDVGLFVKGQLIMELPEAQRAWAVIKARVVKGLSIGFMEIDADPWWDPERVAKGEPREIRKVDLREVSPVTFPALREAQLDVVKQALARGERPRLREFQDFIQRELGLSGSQAAYVAEHGYKDWISREVGPEATHDLEGVTQSVESTIEQFNTPLFG